MSQLAAPRPIVDRARVERDAVLSRTPDGEFKWTLVGDWPAPGEWTVDDYHELTNINILVELTDGYIEVLPMPTMRHIRLTKFFALSLDDWAEPEKLGEALFAPVPVVIAPGREREPDVFFIRREHDIPGEDYPSRVDLVAEVVSPDRRSHRRDHVDKRRDYAAAGVPEYWLIDPQLRRVIVLALRGGRYEEHGTFGPGDRATSPTLDGFSVDVDALFAAGDAA